MGNRIEFTVVVPTRERADVLADCLRSILAQSYAHFRVIVSDNFSQDATRDVVESFDDARITYLNTGRRLNMSDNWEFALGHVETGWVTIVGDDDGLLPDSLARAAQIILATGTQALRSSVCAYQWPSLTGRSFGQIRIPLQHGVEIRNADLWLGRVLDARASYLDLPMLYNGGFVEVSVLETLKARTGRIYRSAIPDVYAAVAIASVLDSYVWSAAPLAVNGASRHSTGSSQFSGRHRDKDSPASRFVTEENIPFHPDLPLPADGHYPPSLQLLVYESWLQSAALRPAASVPAHARQLELILATAGRYREDMEDWGRLFGARHGLDFDAIRRRADRTKLLRRPSTIWRKLARKRHVHEAGSPDVPLETVAAACRYAAEVLKSNISKGT